MLATVVALGASAYELARFAGALAHLPPVTWHKRGAGIELFEPAPDYRAARTVYPYSVVQGGVHNDVELAASMAQDPLVAWHYRDILPSRLYLTRLSATADVYASFRVANSIYWTARKIHVPKGELILTDGAHMIRARCGNRLAFAAPAPDWPNAPAQGGLTPPTPEPPPIEPPELVFDYGLPAIYAPPLSPPPEVEEAVSAEAAHFWPPVTPRPQWCCGPGVFPFQWQPVRPGRPGRPKPLSAAPAEPGTIALLGTGIVGVAYALRHRFKM